MNRFSIWRTISMKQSKTIFKTLKFVYCSSKRTVILIAIFTFLLGLIVPINTYIWSKFINVLFSSYESNVIPKLVFVLILIWCLWIVQMIIQKANKYLKDMLTDHLNLKITESILNKQNGMTMSQFDNPKIYNKINKINTEGLSRSISVTNNLILLLQNIVSFIGTAVILVTYNPILLILLCFVFIPILAIDIKISTGLYEIYNERIEKLRLVTCLKDLMLRYENIKEIKIYNMGSFLLNRITDTYKKYLNQDKVIRKCNMKKQIWGEIGEYISKFCFTLYVIIDGITKQKDIGTIILYINTIDILMQNIGDIEYVLSEMYDDNLYMESVFDFLEEPMQHREGKKKLENINSIELKDIYFKYPNTEKYILENINLKLYKEKSYLLVGENGAGKTTLVKILCGLYEPTSGEIYINGENIKKYDLESYRKRIGVVFQDFIHFPLSVEDNIKLGNIDDYENDDSFNKMAELVGVDDIVNKLPEGYKTQLQNEWMDGTELSIGQWQKIAIARGLFSNGSVLIMDEPTASLDSLAENEIFQCIKTTLNKQISIIISHRYSMAQIVDKIIVISNNTIAEEGQFTELIRKGGKFYKYYSVQADRYKKGKYDE